ncbi:MULTISPECIES: UDP-3-O-(3-hydroxymyristoyl)glucosamine N-acyltransferase [Paraburkholderia]|jgi:UDP-3-O-[3-hydroxymyristoyl] glucosamine N-acyltransferase|uniref:UDP-3-O-acylglucosamine N-acyltransferase n=1 Tax=Paraburkholderia caribensis TaxID=75105 RepID=A0A9Q6WK03_9BURK|nr:MULTISPECIES: UDP-3-O-(3-hydroxymyristoyl)glucosamine N-acyltransferase [Paraburkholderia]ALP63205.1 UDP-3-O-(3-hydroxymyristoyl)glucosamine N-acyltransferase [Paraburkholderia caribensis]AMV42410.1 UDP-3-O-(3-hydroxymyristoyl)glucosamine N-acyltransferase [Paraburkholderia caribensis]AUT51557.1 UDP-3-O-(3-hydroxymyristoyl)glucosamine N-acyltransferase [Paraburkholderia caribensis]MCO4878628.1 UDP-3-O-(3-hydroxymyristoyl)glucosamine N-acyltransferase [Paraburkholderia caribensis]MDR6383629.
MAFTLEEIVQQFGGEIVGDRAHRVSNLAPLDQAGPDQLAFLANPKYLAQVETTRAGAVLINAADLEKVTSRDARNFIVTPNPYAYFARLAQAFIDMASPKAKPGVHPSATIDPSAQIAASAVIGPNVTVEAGASIGEKVRLDANVFVGRGTQIAAGSHLYPNVAVYHGCKIGERVIIHAGAVIGSDGFGFAPDFVGEGDARTGSWVKIPQVGGVSIGPDVEIGANTTIDRGAMADTVIEECVKIDNLVQIGHNCKIGAYTVIAGCAGIAGSTTIGRHCMIGGAVGIAGHVTLADYVIVTAKSGVSKSLLKPGMYTSAFPAVDHADWNRSAALMRNLDKLRDRIKALEAAVASASGDKA